MSAQIITLESRLGRRTDYYEREGVEKIIAHQREVVRSLQVEVLTQQTAMRALAEKCLRLEDALDDAGVSYGEDDSEAE